MPSGCATRPFRLLPTSSPRQRSCCLRLRWKEELVFPNRNCRGCSVQCAGAHEPAKTQRLRHGPAFMTDQEGEEGGKYLAEMERRLSSEGCGLICGDEELKLREQGIAAAVFAREERLEVEVKQATSSLVSQATEIEGLKIRVGDMERSIKESLSAVSMKEDEIIHMRNEFMKRNERAAMIGDEIESRALLLLEADELIYEHEREIEQLWESVRQKEEEVEASLILRKEKEGELKAAESFLAEQTREWLLALEELKQLVNGTSRWVMDSDKAAVEGFGLLRRLTVDARNELMKSWRSLASSRQELENDVYEMVPLEHMREIEEEKESLASYMASLMEARKEVESEKMQLAVVESRYEALKRELEAEQQLIQKLQEDVAGEKVLLDQVAQDVSLLQEELNVRAIEYLETQELLRVKESELAEAKLEIQHLDLERHPLQQMLEEDLQLLETGEELQKAFLEVPNPSKIMKNDLDGVKLEQGEASMTVEGQTVDQRLHELAFSLDKTEKDPNLLSHQGSGKIASATADLRKLTEACRQLLHRTRLVPDSSSILEVSESSSRSGRRVSNSTITKEIAQLMALSEQLVAEAELK